MSVRRLKVAASLLLAIPTGILLLFLVGEVAGGELSGVQHLLQLSPLLALAALAWRHPQAGGAALIAVGTGLGVAYPLLFSDSSMRVILGVELLLFAPPVLAGALFLLAGFRADRHNPE